MSVGASPQPSAGTFGGANEKTAHYLGTTVLARASSNSRHIGVAGSTGGRERWRPAAAIPVYARPGVGGCAKVAAERFERLALVPILVGLVELLLRRAGRARARSPTAGRRGRRHELRPARRASRSTSTRRARPRCRRRAGAPPGRTARRGRHGAAWPSARPPSGSPTAATSTARVRAVDPEGDGAAKRAPCWSPTTCPAATAAATRPADPARPRPIAPGCAGFARGIGPRRATVILEPDAIPQAGRRTASSAAAKAERYALLARRRAHARGAAQHRRLHRRRQPRLGAPARPPGRAAARSPASRAADGFALNVSNFYRTGHVIALRPRALAPAGRRALRDRHEPQRQRPQPPGRRRRPEVVQPARAARSGAAPRTSTGQRKVDAYLWVKQPGASDGSCRAGAPPAGHWWPEYALALVRNR